MSGTLLNRRDLLGRLTDTLASTLSSRKCPLNEIGLLIMSLKSTISTEKIWSKLIASIEAIEMIERNKKTKYCLANISSFHAQINSSYDGINCVFTDSFVKKLLNFDCDRTDFEIFDYRLLMGKE